MAKYRIVKQVRSSSRPVAIWVDKPSDAAVVSSAMALLRRGESAEVWGETALIKRVHRKGLRTAGPRLGEVLAGLAMTISVGLLLMTVHDAGLSPVMVAAGQRPATAQAFDVSHPALASAPVRAAEADVPVEAAPLQQDRPATPSSAPRAGSNKPRLASARAAPTALFPAVPHAQTNVYGLMGPGFPQGGN